METQEQSLPFVLEKLVMQHGTWLMSLKIFVAIPKVYKVYELKMSLDDSPYIRRIKANKQRMDDLLATPSLLTEEDEETKQRLKEEMTLIEKDFAEDKKICPDVIFTAYVTKAEYRIGETLITFNVARQVINQLNDLYNLLEKYAIFLHPII